MQAVDAPPLDRFELYPDENMKLRDEDKDWLAKEISTQLEAAVDTFKPHGWRKLAYWAKEWGIAGAIIAAFVTLFGITLGAVYQSFSHVEKETEFRTKTGERLDEIEKELREIHADTTKQSLINHAALPLADFTAALPDLNSALLAAQKQKLKVPATVIKDISQKMAATDKTAPSFWQIAAVVITLRSSTTAGGSQDWTKVLTPCKGPVDILGADKNAAVQVVHPDGTKGSKTSILRIGESDCYADIDGKTISKWDCTRCVIKYSGGPISITDAKFVDCLFVTNVPPVETPPQNGQHLIETLLAATALDRVSLSD